MNRMVNFKIQDKKVIYLNTEANCTKLQTTNTLKNLKFSWFVPF